MEQSKRMSSIYCTRILSIGRDVLVTSKHSDDGRLQELLDSLLVINARAADELHMII